MKTQQKKVTEKSDVFLKQLKELLGDNSLYFDDYDMNERPIYVSKKNDIEYTIDKHGNVYKHDDFKNKKVGKILINGL